MNREIKFRAWDAEQNKMIETFDGEYQIGVNEEDGALYCGGYMPNGDWNEPPLMQFTGIHDGNGKKIFEGDLLKTADGLLQVVYEDGCFFAETKANGAPCFSYTNSDNIFDGQIIGNIYQNPELL